MVNGLCYDEGALLLDVSGVLALGHRVIGRCLFFHVLVSPNFVLHSHSIIHLW